MPPAEPGWAWAEELRPWGAGPRAAPPRQGSFPVVRNLLRDGGGRVIGGEALLRAILQVLDEGIHVIDTSGVTVFYNQAAARVEGLEPSEVVGRHLLEVFPSLTEETSTLLKVLRTRRPILNQQQTFTNYKGHRVTTVNSSYPILVDGRLVGALEVSKDITRVRELAEAVQDLRAALWGRRRSRAPDPGSARYRFEDLVGEDPGFRQVVEKARRAARGDAPVLVVGETGTGKELLVQAIHNGSPRAGQPFIAQNCAALPEGLLEAILFGTVRGSFTGAEDRPGLFELADGGTLFLDEINAMPLGLQAKLLRVLQDGRVRRVGDTRERAVDVRVIAAIGEDPLAAVAEGRLRRDLFHRVSVVYLELPPLRQRRGDIPLLCEHFLARHRSGHQSPARRLAPEVMELFLHYHWPGNVRELENAIEGALAVARGEVIALGDLPAPLLRAAPAPQPLRRRLALAEREAILQALAAAGGRVAGAARLLGIPRQTLQYRLRVLGISRPGPPRRGSRGQEGRGSE